MRKEVTVWEEGRMVAVHVFINGTHVYTYDCIKKVIV